MGILETGEPRGHDPILLGRLFGRRFSKRKRLVKELASLLQIRLASAGVGFEISLLSIHQVHVAHGVRIVWFEIELLQKRFQALVYQGADLLREFVARLRREGRQLALCVRHIQLQFLAESIVLSLIGGAAGVLFGIFGSYLVGQTLNWPIEMSLEAVVVAAMFSVAVGVFFGYYPARKASLLDPIEALRYE